jgi:glutamyl-tRNA reductase
MNLAVLGINFKSAPVELRETLAFGPEETPAALRGMAERLPGAERVLLSTCNRTELYAAGTEEPPDREALLAALLTGRRLAPSDVAADHVYYKTGIQAAEHLVAVASSLDSMVVGETEVLGQVKRAYTLAQEAGACGRTMQTLFPLAFQTAKRVHAETDIGRGRVSVSSIAVEFAEKVFENLAEKTIMIVGAGETAELALKSLVERGATQVLVLNRSFHRGEALAAQYGGKALQFDVLGDYLPKTDIVISSTGAPHCVVRAEAVAQAVRERHGRPMLLIDIAVPRDIEPAAGRLPNVYLYDIDDLQRVADGNLARRQKAIDQAWGIIREGLVEMAVAAEGDDFRGLMRQFDLQARAVRDAALQRAFSKEALASLPEAAREEIAAVVQKTINKMLAAPRASLHRAARNGQWREYARVARDLFGLESDVHQQQERKEAGPGEGGVSNQ